MHVALRRQGRAPHPSDGEAQPSPLRMAKRSQAPPHSKNRTPHPCPSQIIEQQVTYMNLVKRNQAREVDGQEKTQYVDSISEGDTKIALPFIVINTHHDTYIQCEMTEDRAQVSWGLLTPQRCAALRHAIPSPTTIHNTRLPLSRSSSASVRRSRSMMITRSLSGSGFTRPTTRPCSASSHRSSSTTCPPLCANPARARTRAGEAGGRGAAEGCGGLHACLADADCVKCQTGAVLPYAWRLSRLGRRTFYLYGRKWIWLCAERELSAASRGIGGEDAR